MPRVGMERARYGGRLVPPIEPASHHADLIFAGVVLLLFSIAVPAPSRAPGRAAEILPLPVLEIAHAVARATGVGLIFLARGLSYGSRRLIAWLSCCSGWGL